MICSRCKKSFEQEKYKTCEKCRTYNKLDRESKPRIYKQGYCSSTDGITKTCSNCLSVKNLKEFYKNKRYKDGYKNTCITCHSELWKKYYVDKYNIVLKQKLKDDPLYRLKQNVKSYIHIQLKNKQKCKKGTSTLYVECNIKFLYDYLKYSNPMYGEKDYHIDHVIPLSLFDLENENAIKIAFNWTNLQIVPKKYNLQKYNNFSTIEYMNHVLSVHRYISKTTQDFTPLKENILYVKTNLLQHFQIAGTPLEP